MALFQIRKPETALEQCLEMILHETGVGFKTGLVAGSVFHLFKGFCRSPNGARLAGAWHAMGFNARRVAGRFGAWFALSTSVECALGFARPKDDQWNCIAGSAAASGLLSAHRGLGASVRFASLTGSLFVAMEVIPIVTKLDENSEDKEPGRKCRKC